MEVLLENNEVFKVNEKGLLYSYTKEDLINSKIEEVHFSKQVTGKTMRYAVITSKISLVLLYENDLSVLIKDNGDKYFFREEAVLFYRNIRFWYENKRYSWWNYQCKKDW